MPVMCVSEVSWPRERHHPCSVLYPGCLRCLGVPRCAPDAYTYNMVIHMYGREGRVEAAEAVLAQMQGQGCHPDRVSTTTHTIYTTVYCTCTVSCKLDVWTVHTTAYDAVQLFPGCWLGPIAEYRSSLLSVAFHPFFFLAGDVQHSDDGLLRRAGTTRRRCRCCR